MSLSAMQVTLEVKRPLSQLSSTSVPPDVSQQHTTLGDTSQSYIVYTPQGQAQIGHGGYIQTKQHAYGEAEHGRPRFDAPSQFHPVIYKEPDRPPSNLAPACWVFWCCSPFMGLIAIIFSGKCWEATLILTHHGINITVTSQ